MGNIIVITILGVFALLALRSCLRSKRKGCSGGCGSCGGNCPCHRSKPQLRH